MRTTKVVAIGFWYRAQPPSRQETNPLKPYGLLRGNRLNKHKARLCAHGGMQCWGENYWKTYSPVVNMIIVKLLLVVAKIHGLESNSIDFVLAFPQADHDIDIWMELPIGFQTIIHNSTCSSSRRIYMGSSKLVLTGTKSCEMD